MKHITTLLLTTLSLLQAAHAEISGSGTPNSGCSGRLEGMLWHDLNADGIADAGEPGLPAIGLQLFYENGGGPIAAATGASGGYQFDYLCDGDYLIVVDKATVPEGLIVPEQAEPAGESGSDPVGWSATMESDAGEARFDLGYVGCPLSISSSCTVASFATELYSCEKPVDELSLIWSGAQNIRVVAHKGDENKPVLADIDDIKPGDVVTVTGFEGSPNDVIWELFAAGTNTKLGASKFRMDCDDMAMNGPEDCGLRQGNGKDNRAEFINDWLLESVIDSSGLMECSKRSASSETCDFQATAADCDLLDKINWLTFAYTGGGCATVDHNQPDKFECAGDIDDQAAVTITTEDNETFVVEPGNVFTIPRSGSDTDMALSNGLGTESIRIHTSCSRPLAVGDVFGSLSLVAINGLGTGAPVDYEYELKNKTNQAIVTRTQEAPRRTLNQSDIALQPQSTRTVAGSAWIMATTNNAILAQYEDGANAACNGADYIDVIVNPPAPCEISGSGWQFHDKELRWDLGNTVAAPATIDRIEISWPGSVTDKLKEIKLDGDKIFDQDVIGSSVVIEASDLMGSYYHKNMSRGASKQLKLIFEDDIQNVASPGDFEVRLSFAQGCYIDWTQEYGGGL
ncbi:MAG: hypothetical protein OEQ74_01210 [Gammaproteobacteria bacterium]|nr:hypothetical protein [Gammaproteobacteria bacterium]